MVRGILAGVMVGGALLTGMARGQAVSGDGKRAAFFEAAADSSRGDGKRVLVVVELATGKTERVDFGKAGDAPRVAWMGGEILAGGYDQSVGVFPKMVDAGTGTLRDAKGLGYGIYPAFASVWGGKACMIVPGAGNESQVFGLPGMEKIGKLDFAVRGVGGGWMVRYEFPKDATWTSEVWVQWSLGANGVPVGAGKRASLEGLRLLGENGEEKLRLDGKVLEEAFPRGLNDTAALLSPDRKTLLVAPEHRSPGGTANADTIRNVMYLDGFAAYEVGTGKLLWKMGGQQRVVLPLVMENDGGYGVEEVIPVRARGQAAGRGDHTFWLTRFDAAGGTRVVQLPLTAGEGLTAEGWWGSNGDAGMMVIRTLLTSSRLVVVPLKKEVKAEEVREIGVEK